MRVKSWLGVVVLGVIVLSLPSIAVACGGGSSSSGSGSSPAGMSSSETFTRLNWASLDSNADAHKGAKVDIVGQVFTAPERDDKGTYIQMWSDPQNSEWNTIVAIPDPNFQVNDQDYVHITGTVKGSYTGKYGFGGDVTAVTVLADHAEVVDATAAAPPATAVTTVHQTQAQHGVSITVEKVEFAQTETRVFVTVKNDSKQKASFYSFDAKAVQGTQQFDADSNLDYPEVSSDILPGVSSSGIVVFKPMDSSQPTKLVFQAQNEDYMLNWKPYTFHVQAGTPTS